MVDLVITIILSLGGICYLVVGIATAGKVYDYTGIPHTLSRTVEYLLFLVVLALLWPGFWAYESRVIRRMR